MSLGSKPVIKGCRASRFPHLDVAAATTPEKRRGNHGVAAYGCGLPCPARAARAARFGRAEFGGGAVERGLADEFL